MNITCKSGHVIHAKKVLLATGAFTGFRDLLPNGITPDIQLLTRSLIFAEVPSEKLDYFRY